MDITPDINVSVIPGRSRGIRTGVSVTHVQIITRVGITCLADQVGSSQ